MKFGSIAIVSLIVLLLTGCTTIKVEESHFLYPDKKITMQDIQNVDATAKKQEVTLSTDEGITLKGTLIKVADARATVIYFGGNQFRVSAAGGDPAKLLLPFQVNLLMMDHRGYGLSSGVPSVANLKADALLVFDYVKGRADLSTLPVVIHGHSLGSMIAGYVASQRNVDALVLEGSVTNVEQMTAARIPWFAKPFVSVEFSEEINQVDNLKVLQVYQAPLLIITGEKDTQTPPELAEDLYQHAKSQQKQLYIAKGKHHSNALTGKQLATHYEQLLKQITLSKSS